MGRLLGLISGDQRRELPPAELRPDERLQVRLWLADREEPVTEIAHHRRAEQLFAETRDDESRWSNVVAAELVGDDGDILDRW